jgi:hypothetical protein
LGLIVRSLDIQSTVPQARFHQIYKQREVPNLAFVGGFGAGKTETLCNNGLIDGSQGSDSIVGLYEPNYRLVKLLGKRLCMRLKQNGIRHFYNQSDSAIYTSNSGFGDFILRSMDNPDSIVMYETTMAHVDELDTLKTEHAKNAWEKIIGRNRGVIKIKPDLLNTACAYSTPEGFRFMYEAFREKARCIEKNGFYKYWMTDNGYGMIQASNLTNPFLKKSYIENMRATYSTQLVDAYIDGEFVNLTSGAVYPQFDRDLNHSDRELKEGEPIHIGMDFNVNNMSAIIHIIDEDGNPVAVDEIGGGRDTPSIIETIKDRYWGPYGEETRTISIYPDSSGKNSSSKGASESDIAFLDEAGFYTEYDSVNPRVKDRVNAMNAMFCNDQNQRRYKVNTRKCSGYTKDLEQQVYNDAGEPDKSKGKDHKPDAGGYFIANRFAIIRPVSEGTFEWPM